MTDLADAETLPILIQPLVQVRRHADWSGRGVSEGHQSRPAIPKKCQTLKIRMPNRLQQLIGDVHLLEAETCYT